MSEKVFLYRSPITGRGLLYTGQSIFAKNPRLLAINEIGEFNRKTLQNRVLAEMEAKHKYIQTFTNQVYNLMLRKANGEFN